MDQKIKVVMIMLSAKFLCETQPVNPVSTSVPIPLTALMDSIYKHNCDYRKIVTPSIYFRTIEAISFFIASHLCWRVLKRLILSVLGSLETALKCQRDNRLASSEECANPCLSLTPYTQAVSLGGFGSCSEALGCLSPTGS